MRTWKIHNYPMNSAKSVGCRSRARSASALVMIEKEAAPGSRCPSARSPRRLARPLRQFMKAVAPAARSAATAATNKNVALSVSLPILVNASLTAWSGSNSVLSPGFVLPIVDTTRSIASKHSFQSAAPRAVRLGTASPAAIRARPNRTPMAPPVEFINAFPLAIRTRSGSASAANAAIAFSIARKPILIVIP